MAIIRQGKAHRVIVYAGYDEPMRIENAEVTLHEGGIVMIKSPEEDSTYHLSQCEIVWWKKQEPEPTPGPNVVRIKP